MPPQINEVVQSFCNPPNNGFMEINGNCYGDFVPPAPRRQLPSPPKPVEEQVEIVNQVKQQPIGDKEKLKKKPETAPTLADKIKQSLSQLQQHQDYCSPSPPLKPVQAQQPQPRVVVKEIAVAKPPKDKTRSLMVRGLYRGIKIDDLMKYFGQFGAVINITSPPCVVALDDGLKYAFLKFADYESVEKAIGKEKQFLLLFFLIFVFS